MSFFDDVQKARRVGKEKREKEEAARVQREAVKQTPFVDERINDLVKTAKRLILAAAKNGLEEIGLPDYKDCKTCTQELMGELKKRLGTGFQVYHTDNPNSQSAMSAMWIVSWKKEEYHSGRGYGGFLPA